MSSGEEETMTEPNETAEPSAASAGYVAGEPVAWAALRDDGDIAWIGYTPEGAADGACGRRIVPLYRSPTLTDAEREAVGMFAATAWTGLRWSDVEKHAATLRGLLGRIG